MSISAAMHAVAIVLVLFGASWFSGGAPRPLNVTSVELVNGAQFDAAVSTAPVVPNKGPAELSPPSDTKTETIKTAEADSSVKAPKLPMLAKPKQPADKQPKLADIAIPPPPTPVPSEAPRPSIAKIPTPDTLPRQAETPESPPATEPQQPLASAPSPQPDAVPSPPPPTEPVATDTPTPQPAKPKQPPKPQAVAEAQPQAPVAHAPQAARLPVAKPAKLAAAARASSAPPPATPAPTQEPKKPPKPVAQKPAGQTKPDAQKPAGGSTSQFADIITRGEKDALRLGIKQYFVYDGNRADRSLQVTIGIELGRDARIIAGPKLLNASGGDAGAQQALWQAGRRALLKAENAGEFAKLPPAKYEGWRRIHVTFTPEEIGFSS